MWSSSNMFLKKLITNLCFPRSTSSSSSSFNNKATSSSSSCAVAAAALTARHFSTPPVHNHEKEHLPDLANSCDDKSRMMFNTLYASTTAGDDDADDDLSIFFTSSSNSDDANHLSDHHPDFATVFASQRFFFSSPGHSKSLIHQSTPPTHPAPHDVDDDDGEKHTLLLSAGGIPVPKYSPDPYSDFRRSMQEMVEAKVSRSKDPAENWEYLHQLLTCYLSLNPRYTHECIIKAFSDLVVNFLFDKDSAAAARRNDGRRRRRAVSRPLIL